MGETPFFGHPEMVDFSRGETSLPGLPVFRLPHLKPVFFFPILHD